MKALNEILLFLVESNLTNNKALKSLELDQDQNSILFAIHLHKGNNEEIQKAFKKLSINVGILKPVLTDLYCELIIV